MKRYDLLTNYRCGSSIEEMELSDDGEWVRYEEVETALAQVEAERDEAARPRAWWMVGRDVAVRRAEQAEAERDAARAKIEELQGALAPAMLTCAAHMLRECAHQIEALAVGYGAEQMKSIATMLDTGALVVRKSLLLDPHPATPAEGKGNVR